MNIYEHNFARLVRLLPEILISQNRFLHQALKDLVISIEVLESHRYTTVIRMAQELEVSIPGVESPAMVVRVYHDAKVAEVLSYQGHFRFNPKYEYPNPKMRQIREKRRVNDFLGEWLDYCLSASVRRRQVIST